MDDNQTGYAVVHVFFRFGSTDIDFVVAGEYIVYDFVAPYFFFVARVGDDDFVHQADASVFTACDFFFHSVVLSYDTILSKNRLSSPYRMLILISLVFFPVSLSMISLSL